MDIFLSVCDDIKLEVFEVGPPLPPSAMTAKDMMEALDERYGQFKFEEYHHVFCHFLNLHIDQYPSLAEFNTEFSATLQDLLDHGYPLNNIQACSAYFSKLRCTQNPWVAKKLKEWDSLPTPPLLEELMKECPPWMIIRPLATKTQASNSESYTEDNMSPPSLKEEDGESSDTDKSEALTASPPPSLSHSRNPSTQSLEIAAAHPQNISAQSEDVTVLHSRTFSDKSLEITVGASMEDLRTMAAFPLPTQRIPKTPKTRARRMSSKSDISKMSLPPPINRPLPPIPATKSVPNISSPTEPRPDIRPQTTPPSDSPSTPIASKRPASSHASPSMPTLFPPFPPEQIKRPVTSRGSASTLKSTPATNSTNWPSPTRSPPQPPTFRRESNDSSIISLPLQGTKLTTSPTVPEYHDTVLSGNGAVMTSGTVGLGLSILSSPSSSSPKMESRETSSITISTKPSTGSSSSTPPSAGYLGASPPRSLMSRLSAELNKDVDEEEQRKKEKEWKRSWGRNWEGLNLKGRLSGRRLEVKEII